MDGSEGVMVLSFVLSGRLSGFPIESVEEVLQMVALTPIPDAPGFVAGAINLRGSVLPVVDMAALIGEETAPYTLDTPIIVVRRGEDRLGLVVDSVHDVSALSREDIDAPSDMFPARRLLAGVARTGDGLLMLYDLERVLELSAGAVALVGQGGADG